MSHAHVFAERPLRIYWETTRSCDLACRHCRATAVPDADPNELTPADGLRLLEQLARFGAPLPHLVLTGGDALKRADLFELIAAAQGHGFQVSVAPSATPLLTADALRRLKAAGVDAISLSLDGSTAERHDFIRGIPGTYERTLVAARTAREVDLPFQVNTLVCAETIDDLPVILQQVRDMGAARWSLFFLVTVGRGSVLQPISPERAEELLTWLSTMAGPPRPGQLIITTTEAPHYRRVVAERRRAAHGPADAAQALGIKIYAIGVGTHGIAQLPRKDAFGRKVYVPMNVDIDDQALTQIAERTGGKYYRATNPEQLKEIYQEIEDRIEGVSEG